MPPNYVNTMQSRISFEICAVNIQSAKAAQSAGGHRIELCSAIDTGGVTPSPGLIRHAVTQLDIPVNVLIRPREGNFCFSEAEVAIMLDDIRFCREAGANGVVVGALDANGQLDLDALSAFKSAAGEMELVCHRAFDFTPDPFAALEQLIELGFARVLSSGQADNAFSGRVMLGKLVDAAAGRISIMPGSGIDASNIAEIVRETGASEFHFTGKRKVCPPGQPIAGLDAAYWISDPELIKNTIIAATGRPN